MRKETCYEIFDSIFYSLVFISVIIFPIIDLLVAQSDKDDPCNSSLNISEWLVVKGVFGILININFAIYFCIFKKSTLYWFIFCLLLIFQQFIIVWLIIGPIVYFQYCKDYEPTNVVVYFYISMIYSCVYMLKLIIYTNKNHKLVLNKDKPLLDIDENGSSSQKEPLF